MQQIALHVCIIYFVTELLATYIISYKTDTFGRHHRQPTLGVFAKQQHGGYRQISVRADKAQIAHQFVQVMSLGNGIGDGVKRCFTESIADQTFFLQYDGETVLQKYFEGVFIQIVQSCISYHRFIWGKAAAFGHHLGQFCIVKDLALVCTVFYPDNAFVVMVRFVIPFFDGGHNHASALHACRINVKQDAWGYILRSDIAKQIGCFLHLSIRQGVKFSCLVVDAYYKLTSTKVAHSNQFAAYIVFIQDTFLELYLAYLTPVPELEYIFCRHIT